MQTQQETERWLVRGHVEPHTPLLRQLPAGARLHKVMQIEHLLQSIEGRYLHFTRVDQYRDFTGADPHDSAPRTTEMAAPAAKHF